jgi:hypothetical protein
MLLFKVLLFARNLNKGYVYCGRLGYNGHDPDRIPVRFVWEVRMGTRSRIRYDETRILHFI